MSIKSHYDNCNACALTKKEPMKRNIESNREKLAKEELSNMDWDAMEEYIRDQFEEYYKTLTPIEFDEQWNSVLGE